MASLANGGIDCADPGPESLGEALNSERAAANIVQALVIVIVAILVVGIAIGV